MKHVTQPRTLAEAAALQRTLQQQVILEGDPHPRYLVALDASHPTRFSKVKGDSVAAAVLWDKTKGRSLEVATAFVKEAELFPYVPGFLSFRESPVYLEAIAQLKHAPELVLVDGQGIAHPRRFGIACHLGIQLNLPCVGVAKTLLYGKPEAELASEVGAAVRLMAQGEQIGWVYRSRSKVKPLYISPGHRIGMQETLELVRSLVGKTRLLEPLRQAHIEAGEARRRRNTVR